MSVVDIRIDGRSVRAEEGTTIAAAMFGSGVTAFRRSVGGAARGPLCGMGTCFECRVTINGIAHQRSCMTVVKAGMEISTR